MDETLIAQDVAQGAAVLVETAPAALTAVGSVQAALAAPGDALDKVDHVAQAATAAGLTVVQAAAAVMGGGGPAPADPVQQQIAALHARMTAVEQALNVGAAVVGQVVPSAAPVVARVGQVETVLETVATFVQNAEPQLAKLWAAFGHKL